MRFRQGTTEKHFDGFTVANDVADYGNPAFTTYTPPTAPDNSLFELRFVRSTNGTSPGKRLYVWSAEQAAWSYVALT